MNTKTPFLRITYSAGDQHVGPSYFLVWEDTGRPAGAEQSYPTQTAALEYADKRFPGVAIAEATGNAL